MKPASTMTVASVSGMARGTLLQIDTGADAEIVKVRRITGPFTVDVSPLTRWERARMWAYRWWRRAVNPIARAVREWRLSRCDARLCWRRETFVDVEWDAWCRRHADGKEIRHEA